LAFVFSIGDDHASRDATELFLKSEGINTKTFSDYESFIGAIEYVNRRPYCITSDLRGSDAGGDGVVNSLVTIEACVPIVVFSPYRSPISRALACSLNSQRILLPRQYRKYYARSNNPL
jgi:FixJ family two-component response regulator